MKTVIVHAEEPVLLLGGGDVPATLLTKVLRQKPQIVCADGGANLALAMGVMPQAVIGDMDSLSKKARAALPPERLFVIPEQETTDFDKCLRHIAAPLVLGMGFDGSRLDHQLAAYTVLVRRAERRCVLITEHQLVFLAPPKLEMALPLGSLLSLFPMGPVRGQSLGMRWPINGLQFAPDGRIGTSNEVSGPVTLTMDAPRMLVILPVTALDDVISALLGCAAQWPARVE